jgi:hypothetical protein
MIYIGVSVLWLCPLYGLVAAWSSTGALGEGT